MRRDPHLDAEDDVKTVVRCGEEGNTYRQKAAFNLHRADGEDATCAE